VIPENIHTHPRMVIGNSEAEGRVSKAKIMKESANKIAISRGIEDKRGGGGGGSN